MSKPIERREDMQVEIDGVIYSGYRIIKGSRTCYQTIYFLDRSKPDSHKYPKSRQHIMESSADQILRHLVHEYLQEKAAE